MVIIIIIIICFSVFFHLSSPCFGTMISYEPSLVDCLPTFLQFTFQPCGFHSVRIFQHVWYMCSDQSCAFDAQIALVKRECSTILPSQHIFQDKNIKEVVMEQQLNFLSVMAMKQISFFIISNPLLSHQALVQTPSTFLSWHNATLKESASPGEIRQTLLWYFKHLQTQLTKLIRYKKYFP